MWSGAIACVQPRRAGSTPWTVSTFEPIPSICAPIVTEQPRRGPARAARRRRCGSPSAPGVSAAAISAFSVAITDGSSMRKSHGAQARRRLEHDSLASCSTSGAERAERVEVRVEPAAADHVAARGRHARAAEPGQQRAREQERRADLARQLGVDLGVLSTSARVKRSSFGADATATRAPSRSSSVEHRLDVADPRDVAEHRPRRR